MMKTCDKCHEKNVGKSKLCEVCSLKRTSCDLFGTEKRWQHLAALLQKQNFTCPYTGIKLFIGVNASIDHKIPKALDGGNDLGNLEWVHIWINKMKYVALPEEFNDEFDVFLEKTIAHRKTSAKFNFWKSDFNKVLS